VTHAEVTTTRWSEETECGIRDVLDRVGDKWTLLVGIELTHGVRRFRQLQRAVRCRHA
jgi:DNA-binding HxlR family transcriptional regulator